ncbi:MAG TPA: hypothetical protein VHN59_15365 [Chitinophagaceae bacterium]|nr:hypothetical protein [Chitinophagaceae bacterium]
MSAFFIILIILFIFGWLTYHNAKANRRKRLEELKAQWGKPKKEHFPFHLIEQYSTVADDLAAHELSAQTMADIDFYEVFSFVDRTVSKPGQQFLFNKLKIPVADEKELLELDRQADFFLKDEPLRIYIQEQLWRLSEPESYSIPELLKEKLLQRPSWFNWLYLDLAIVIILLALSFIYPVCLILLIIPLAINMFLHFWNSNNTFGFIRSLPQLNRLIRAVELIGKQDIPVENGAALRAVAALKGFRKKLNYITLGGDGGVKDELAQAALYIWQMLKAVFLVEVITFFKLVKELENKQAPIRDLFKFIGQVDAALSVASLRSGELQVCKPVFLKRNKQLSIEDAYHPLIENCTRNSIAVNGKSILITGSNMSGKTSFLRMVAVNSLLSQTLYTCFAAAYSAPFVRLSSSIRIDDNLLEGKSYYFEEVNVMGELIQQSQSGDQNLFMLDEVFKGTNTVERIAAARAILSYLNKNGNIVFVSTHDIELAGMLEEEYDLYHFSETVKDGELYFDHQLKKGSLTTRNAIRILEMAGYPGEIIQNARNYTT